MTDVEQRRPNWFALSTGCGVMLIVAALAFWGGMQIGQRPAPVPAIVEVGLAQPAGVGTGELAVADPTETDLGPLLESPDDGLQFRELLRPASKTPPQGNPLQGLDELLTKSLTEWEVPGLSVAIVKDDAVVYAKGFGRRKVGAADTVDERTLFNIASISKTFTTTLAGMLVDDEKIAWDEPLVKYLPDFQLYDPWVTQETTFRDVLCHRVGLARGDDLWFNTKLDRADVLKRLPEVKPNASFRGNFGYQNMLYLAAGEAMAQAAGKTWEELVQERLFTPLGMTSTTVASGTLATAANAATGHDKVGGKLQAVALVNIDNCAPATSMTSNAVDMAQWLRLQLDGGTHAGQQLVSREALRETHTQQVVIPARDPLWKMFPDKTSMTYGLGWILQDYRGRLVIAHPGNINGMRALVALMPEQRLGIVVLSNRALSPMPMALMYNLFDRYLGPLPADRVAQRAKLLKDLERQLAPGNESRGLYAQGNQRLSARRPTEAIAYFDEAIRLDPRYYEAYFARGIARRSQNDLDGALADYSQAIEINPKADAVYADRALTKKMKRDFAGAVADASQALRLNPKSANAYALRGLARLQLGQAEEAQADFDACLRLQPGLKGLLQKELEALRQ